MALKNTKDGWFQEYNDSKGMDEKWWELESLNTCKCNFSFTLDPFFLVQLQKIAHRSEISHL